MQQQCMSQVIHDALTGSTWLIGWQDDIILDGTPQPQSHSIASMAVAEDFIRPELPCTLLQLLQHD
jgi:hypothetical protein